MTYMVNALCIASAVVCVVLNLRTYRSLRREREVYRRATEELLADRASVRRHIEHVRRTSRLAGRFSEN